MILKCGQIFRCFCKFNSKLDRLPYQDLPVLKPALPFSHKVFSNTFHADNLRSGCLPCPIKSICVIYQFISASRPLFYQPTLRLFGCGRFARFGKCRFAFSLPNWAPKQTDERHRPNPNGRWIRHLPWRFVNGSRR